MYNFKKMLVDPSMKLSTFENELAHGVLHMSFSNDRGDGLFATNSKRNNDGSIEITLDNGKKFLIVCKEVKD